MARNTDKIKQDLKDRMKQKSNSDFYCRHTTDGNKKNENTFVHSDEKLHAKEVVKKDYNDKLNKKKYNNHTVHAAKQYVKNTLKEKDDITSGAVEQVTDNAKVTAKTALKTLTNKIVSKRKLSENVRQSTSNYSKKNYNVKKGLNNVGYGKTTVSNFSATGNTKSKTRYEASSDNFSARQNSTQRATNVVASKAKQTAKAHAVAKKGRNAAVVIKKVTKSVATVAGTMVKAVGIAALPLLPLLILVLFIIIIVIMLISPYGFFFHKTSII